MVISSPVKELVKTVARAFSLKAPPPLIACYIGASIHFKATTSTAALDSCMRIECSDNCEGFVLSLSLAALTMPLTAHHSVPASYDPARTVTVSGVVTKVDFKNPHIWVFFDVKTDRGVEQWKCEGGAPNQLFRAGWRPDSLKPGDEITIEGLAARDGSTACKMRSVTRPNGERVFGGIADRTGVR